MKDGDEKRFMTRALGLARRGVGLTHPNPMVGAVVVREGRIYGEGWHRGPGEPHAEAVALEMAGEAARGSTLYVTLEPCDHHGRTPPCTEAILKAGVVRVEIACEDPHPLVRGKGLRRLRDAGIEVKTGLGRTQAEEINRAFLHFARENVPYVTLKLATTLDGRTADASGNSRWITGERARLAVHRLRSQVDAVLVGAGTVLADDPLLNVRGIRGGGQPLRVVLDPELRISPASRIVGEASDGRTIVFVRRGIAVSKKRFFEERGVRFFTLPVRSGMFGWNDMAACLVDLGVLHLLVEGGAQTATWFLARSAVRRVELFLAMKLLGDTGLPSVMDLHVAGLGNAVSFDLRGCRVVGEDVRITADAR